MEIKSIVNKDAVHISTCESEPIHIPGSIQPHGFLLAVESENFTIAYCSNNIHELLQLTPEQVLDASLEAVNGDMFAALKNFLQNDMLQDHPVLLLHNSAAYDLMIRKSGSFYILEVEKRGPISLQEHQLFDQTRQFVQVIEQARSLQDMCRQIADTTRQLTGYDRVMIYRFDKAYNGEVFAESKREDLEPFLGLHYPHTDIPAQARDLYLRNLLRIVVDVNYTPVPIVTKSGGSHKDLDLGDVKLRSVSPIHIEYLKNMGVSATLTISLLQDGKLWGLIACHHYSPKYITYTERQMALLQGHFLSSQIKVRQVAEEYEVNVSVEAHLQQLLHRLGAEEDFDQKFEQFTSLLSVTNSSGAIILYAGQLYEKGVVPPQQKTMELIRWIDKNVRANQYSTSFLSSRYPEATAISRYASGLFYYALGKPTENCIIWFREEVERTINWAGNPANAVQVVEDTKSLTPRTSFATWKEQVRYHSREWRVSEINAAMRFASALQSAIHLDHLQREEYQLRLLNNQLQKANEELSNINWITSHDLKEPLRKIHVFASRIMNEEDKQLSEQIKKSVEKIQNSAVRMQHLVEDIVVYSLTSQAAQSFMPTDLNVVVEVVKEELSQELESSAAVITADPLPSDVSAVPAQMNELFLNLLSNALKFAKEGAPPFIHISCTNVIGKQVKEVLLEAEKTYYRIDITDKGIGFDSTQNSRIFQIFYRLHPKEAYPGTGVGLSICKKIMEHHRGEIIAEGREGEGATFSVFLPL